MTRFWSRKSMVGIDFQVLGFDDGCNRTYKKYVKYYDEKNSLLYFQANSNKLYLIKLTEEEYNTFRAGGFGLSFEGRTQGIGGEYLMPVTPILINEHIDLFEINNKIQMGKAIATAESLMVKV